MKIVNPTAKLGEEEACNYLKKLGFKILERNYRKSYGEIDIIAIDPSTGQGSPKGGSGQATLCFIEVKARNSNKFGSPLESITYWKLKSLMKTAQYYKMCHPKLPEGLRIDAVSVVLNNNKVEGIELIRNISDF